MKKWALLYGSAAIWRVVGPFETEEEAEMFAEKDEDEGYLATVHEMEAPK